MRIFYAIVKDKEVHHRGHFNQFRSDERKAFASRLPDCYAEGMAVITSKNQKYLEAILTKVTRGTGSGGGSWMTNILKPFLPNGERQ